MTDTPREDDINLFGRVFAHLMFDRAYFKALKANGFEVRLGDSAPFPPLTPAGLTDVARNQWVADFKALVAYAKVQERIEKLSASVGTTPSPRQNVSTVVYEAPKPSHPIRQANQELYAANKKLASEKASAEAKLLRTKATLSALASKIETKLESSQDSGDLMQRFSTAVSALLQHSATGPSNTCTGFFVTSSKSNLQSERTQTSASSLLSGF